MNESSRHVCHQYVYNKTDMSKNIKNIPKLVLSAGQKDVISGIGVAADFNKQLKYVVKKGMKNLQRRLQ